LRVFEKLREEYTAIGMQPKDADELVEHMQSATNYATQSKRVVRPMPGFKSMEAAQRTLTGIELMHRLKKAQMVTGEGTQGQTPAQQFNALAASYPPPPASPRQRSKFATHPFYFLAA
jgi:hypothetical protein